MRHEYKYRINFADYYELKSKLKYLFPIDQHAESTGNYRVHSIYFDNIFNKILYEKRDGLDKREKYRIRWYNNNYDYIQLERKRKLHGLCDKTSDYISKEEVIRLMEGDPSFLKFSDSILKNEFFIQIKNQLLQPKCIVDYIREAYYYSPGNVRITFDFDLRVGLDCQKIFDNLYTIPVFPEICIMEVKWDAYLPELVRSILQLNTRETGSFSKYEASRIYL